MNLQGIGARIFGGLVFFMVIGALAACLIALNPQDIETLEVEKPKPIAVKLPDPPKEAELPPPPPDKAVDKSLLADLAPDNPANSMPEMGGVGFGSGGSGPAVAGGGGGGFGSDANQLVKNQTALDRPPRAVFKQPPEYPPEARQRGVSGFVILSIYVAQSGVIENVKIDQSEPRGFFDDAAVKAIRGWKFEPALTKGQTVASWTKQKIKFELN